MKIILITIMSIAVLVGCGGADERKAAYMEKANQSYEAGDFEKAKVDIRNVLQIDPKHSGATYLLGVLAEIDRDYRKAVGLYGMAIELDPNNTKARYNLGKFYLQISDNEKAQEQADKIEAAKPGSSLAKALSGAIAFSEKKYSDAIEILNGISEENRSEDVIILLSASHYGLNDVEKTLEVLIGGIEKYKKSVALRIILAKTYIQKEDKEEALRYLNEIISIEPTNPAHYRTLSNYYEKLGDQEAARNVYYELVENDPDKESFQLLLIQYIAKKNGEEEALVYLKKLISQYPDVEAYAILNANFQLKAKNKEQAIAILEGIVNRKISEKGVQDAKNMLATIKAFDNDIVGAKALINEVLETSPSDIDANFMLAKILFTEKKSSEAIGPLRVVIRENPKMTEAYILLARAHELLGEVNLMHDVIGQGLRENPTNELLEDNYVKLLLEGGKHEYALTVIENTARKEDISNETMVLRGRVYLANNKYDKAEALGLDLIKALPDKDLGYKIVADAYAKQSYFDETKDLLKTGIEATNSADLLVPYIKLLVQLEESEDAITFLKSYSGYKPLTSSMLAELYVSKNDIPTAEKYYKKAIELNPGWDMPYFALGVLQNKNGNISGAIDTYKSAIEKLTDPAKAKVLLATTYHQNGDIKKSVDLYRAIIEANPDNALVINNLALILAENPEHERSSGEALSFAEKIKDTDNVAISDTVAWVYVKSGMYDEAIKIFEDIIAKRSDIAVFKYHLGVAYYHKGDVSLAKQYLEEAVTMQGDAPWINNATTLINEMKQG